MSTVKLSQTNQAKIEALKQKHEKRSLRKKDWDMMMNLVLEKVSDSEWEKMIEKHIPDDVLIRQALSNPEFKKNMADFARKAMKAPAKKKSEKPAQPQTSTMTPQAKAS
jgi:hypothetical protein